MGSSLLKSGYVALACLWLVSLCALGQGRGVVMVEDDVGQPLKLYGGSHALLIGISNYRDWPDLESIPGELDRVERLLKAMGFQVVRRDNLDAQALRVAFQDFIDKHGYDPANRLLFYFSGHGHTWVDGGQGYLVASDAPRPATQQGFPGAPFLRKSLQMSQILAWSRQMAAKHALFLFDSCFSGTVFKTRALPQQPPHISRATALKVRQFITAGSAGEEVPARSVFTPAFVDAIEYRWGDMNGDGYVTGAELGLYLEGKVPQHSRQSPQFGKHPDYELSRGDFVFTLADSAPRPAKMAELTVHSNVRGAAVYIDGEGRGPTGPTVHELTPGTHTVRVEKPPWEPWERRVELAEGESKTLRAELLRQPRSEMSVDRDITKDTRRAGEKWTEPITGMEFVWIPKGCYSMGSPETAAERDDDERQQETCVGGFWLGTHEVTNAEFRHFRDSHDSGQYKDQSLNGDDQPVVNISWDDAVAYAEWLSEQTGVSFSLPTEAEWEYAARAGTESSRYWGDDPDRACSYSDVHDAASERVNKLGWEPHRCDDGYAVTAPVGRFKPNGFGLFDMLGNAWEWTCSAYDEAYGTEEHRCADRAAWRVHRGGSWSTGPRYVRAANRNAGTPDIRLNTVGLRLARTP